MKLYSTKHSSRIIRKYTSENAAAGPRSNWPTAFCVRYCDRNVVAVPGPPPVKTNTEITSGFSLWPQNPTLRNYTVIFTDPSWYSGYINSIIYFLIILLLSWIFYTVMTSSDANA